MRDARPIWWRTAVVVSGCLALAAVCLGLRGVAGVSLVSGGSMRPALCPGDLIVFGRRAGSVGPGDVVVIDRPGWPGGVAHRVVAVEAGGVLRTRGDANPVGDVEPVAKGMVAGRVLFVVPSGRAARAVASAVGRWYTHQPIAHEATTERRLSPQAVTGIGLR